MAGLNCRFRLAGEADLRFGLGLGHRLGDAQYAPKWVVVGVIAQRGVALLGGS